MGHRFLTIGHSNRPLDHFLDLLRLHKVDVLLDVRSAPYSRYSSQFNREPLRDAVVGAGVLYGYYGDRLGGRPDRPDLLENGRPSYQRIAAWRPFQEAIEEVVSGIRGDGGRACLMCSEEDPARCHRRLLVGAELELHGIEMLHVRGDGTIETEDVVRHRLGDDQASVLDLLGVRDEG